MACRCGHCCLKRRSTTISSTEPNNVTNPPSALIRHWSANMDTITVTILDEETPRARLVLLLRHFSELQDEREPC